MRSAFALLAISVCSFAQTYPAHPRLWRPQLNYLATVASNPASPDYAAYQALITEANQYVSGGSRASGIMSTTISAAAHQPDQSLSATISNVSTTVQTADTSTLYAGMLVTGTGIGGNTAITQITDSTHFKLSSYPTINATETLTFAATILTVAENITWNEPNFAIGGIGTVGDCWNPSSSRSINYTIGNGSTTPWLTYHVETPKDSTHIVVAYDSSACTSDWSGTAYGFSESLGSSTQIAYTYEGEGWIAAALDLSLAYRLTGNTVYSDKARLLLDYINNLVSVKNYAMIGADDGYPTRNVWYAVAVIYDWCYDQLTSGQKAATIATIKAYYNELWLVAQGLPYGTPWALVQVTDCPTGQHCPGGSSGQRDLFSWLFSPGTLAANPGAPGESNYWGGNVTGMYYMGAAIAGDDAAGASIMADADAQFDTEVAAIFATGGTVGPTASGLMQEFYGYGNRNLGRLVQYMTARNYVEGINLFTSTDYAQRMAKAQVYGLRPDGWRGTPEWENTGDPVGVLDVGLAQILSTALAGTTEGGWMQYFCQHVVTPPSPIPSGFNNSQYAGGNKAEPLLWYSATNTAVNYTTALPAYLSSQPGDGHAYYRSDWTNGAVWAWFRSSAIQWGPHNTTSAGNVEIQRGNDYVLPNGGQWHGCTGYMHDGSCPDNDGLASGYFNTLFFYDNGEGLSYNCYAGTQYYGCQGQWAPYSPAPQSVANANYVYAQGQLSPAYHGKLPNPASAPHPMDPNVTLPYYIRAWVAVGDNTFVVWDRAQAKKAMNDATTHYVGNVRWHLGTGTSSVSGNTVTNTVGSSKLYISSFLPSGATPTVNVCDVNPFAVMQPSSGAGPWPCTGGGSKIMSRAEVSDPANGTSLNVLTVLYATSSAGSQPTTTAITTDANHVGVLVADTIPKVAVFGLGVSTTSSYPDYAATPYTSVSYTVSYSGTAKHMVADLPPGQFWTARRGGTVLGSGMVGADGTADFTDAVGGAFTVTAATKPPGLFPLPNSLVH